MSRQRLCLFNYVEILLSVLAADGALPIARFTSLTSQASNIKLRLSNASISSPPESIKRTLFSFPHKYYLPPHPRGVTSASPHSLQHGPAQPLSPPRPRRLPPPHDHNAHIPPPAALVCGADGLSTLRRSCATACDPAAHAVEK